MNTTKDFIFYLVVLNTRCLLASPHRVVAVHIYHWCNLLLFVYMMICEIYCSAVLLAVSCCDEQGTDSILLWVRDMYSNIIPVILR